MTLFYQLVLYLISTAAIIISCSLILLNHDYWYIVEVKLSLFAETKHTGTKGTYIQRYLHFSVSLPVITYTTYQFCIIQSYNFK